MGRHRGTSAPRSYPEQPSPLTLAGCPAELGLAAESGQQRPLTRSSLPSCPGSARGTQRASETRAPAPRKANNVHQPRGLRRSTLRPSRLAYSPASLQAGTRPPGPAPPRPQVRAQAIAPRLSAQAQVEGAGRGRRTRAQNKVGHAQAQARPCLILYDRCWALGYPESRRGGRRNLKLAPRAWPLWGCPHTDCRALDSSFTEHPPMEPLLGDH